MLSEPCTPVSAADLWHDRLKQFAHRAAAAGWLTFAVCLAVPDRVPQPVVMSLTLVLSMLAVLCALAAWLVIRPTEGSLREAGGAFAFSLVLLLAVAIVARWKEIAVHDILVPWLKLDLGGPPLNWTLRGLVAALVLWIIIASTLSRRNRA